MVQLPLAEHGTNSVEKKQPLPFQSILQNTITVALLEVNLLPACSDEVHLIVHTNGPREAHKMIEQLCFGDEYWKLKLVSAYRDLSPISADNYVDAFVQNGKQPICFQVSLMPENDAFWQGMFMFTVKVLALQQLKRGCFIPHNLNLSEHCGTEMLTVVSGLEVKQMALCCCLAVML